jgi:hypothetical protein
MMLHDVGKCYPGFFVRKKRSSLRVRAVVIEIVANAWFDIRKSVSCPNAGIFHC